MLLEPHPQAPQILPGLGHSLQEHQSRHQICVGISKRLCFNAQTYAHMSSSCEINHAFSGAVSASSNCILSASNDVILLLCHTVEVAKTKNHGLIDITVGANREERKLGTAAIIQP